MTVVFVHWFAVLCCITGILIHYWYIYILICCAMLSVQNLSSEVQQHLLTIQQLTEQVQALTSLKRSRSTADQQEESVNDSSSTDIDVDTFPGLEVKVKAGDGAVNSIAAISKSPSAVGAVGFGDEVTPSSAVPVHTQGNSLR